MSGELPEQESSRAWRYVCIAFASPALLLPALNLVFSGHTPVGEAVLSIGHLLASFVSGPGGVFALRWESDFPYSPDWAYLLVMALCASAEWAAIWWVGEHWKIRGRAVRWWLLAGVMILFLVCLFIQFVTIMIRHT